MTLENEVAMAKTEAQINQEFETWWAGLNSKPTVGYCPHCGQRRWKLWALPLLVPTILNVVLAILWAREHMGRVHCEQQVQFLASQLRAATVEIPCPMDT
jgi:hypothetical protein